MPDPVLDPVLSFNMRVYRGRVTLSRQTNIRDFGFGFSSRHSTTGLLISVSARTITYLRADRPCDVTTGSGRVGSRVKNPDPLASLVHVTESRLKTTPIV